ncbi:MAG TPA: winged helix-turn-helix domain-containing protein [bacterium]|nr:winged helix-turn-helix domain-containing protein [bacterium]
MSAVESHRSASHLQFGAVTLIPEERLLLRDGQPVPLTPKAFDLLVVLATNPGRLLTKEHLLDAVWTDTTVEESNLSYYVFAIRKALGEHADGDRYIETVPKQGYRFVAPVVRVEAVGRQLPEALAPTADTPQHHEASEQRAAASVGTERRAPTLLTLQAGRVWWRWLGLGAVLTLGAVWFFGLDRPPRASAPSTLVQYLEPVTGRLAETGMFSVSPDGRHLVFAAEGADGILRLWARTMSALEPVPLPGTEVFKILPPVVWSPDSRFVAFDTGGVVKKVSLDGGAPQTVCEYASTAVGGSWNRDGDILLGNALGGLVRCSASGGPVTPITAPEDSEHERHIFPSFLSDGRRFIYLRISRRKPEVSGIYAGELGRASPPREDRLIATGFGAAFVPAADSEPGAIVFARDGALFAQRFDERRLATIGDPIRVADNLGSYLDGAYFSVSAKTLIYRAPEPDYQLLWFDRQARELERPGKPARFSSLALSPDGTRALVSIPAPQGTANQDLWLFDFPRAPLPRRVSFGPALEYSPVWQANDRFVFGSGGGASGVYWQAVDGERQLLFRTGRAENPTSISPDGRLLLYSTFSEKGTGGDVWVRVGEAASAVARPLLERERDQGEALLSPDQRAIAYVSNESGPNEVYVTWLHVDPAAGTVSTSESIRISEGGGFSPRWRDDGRELFYLAPDGSVMAIEVGTTREFRPGAAKRLFTLPGVLPAWGVAPNGTRFLFAVRVSPPPPFHVIHDWQTLLSK